jgi:hypothetical protein
MSPAEWKNMISFTELLQYWDMSRISSTKKEAAKVQMWHGNKSDHTFEGKEVLKAL